MEKFIFIVCSGCQHSNKLSIKLEKSGHYKCGNCQHYLLFYGSQEVAKEHSYFLAGSLAILFSVAGYIGFHHYIKDQKAFVSDTKNVTAQEIVIFKSQCKQTYAQKQLSWSSYKIDEYCNCLTENVSKGDVLNRLFNADNSNLKISLWMELESNCKGVSKSYDEW